MIPSAPSAKSLPELLALLADGHPSAQDAAALEIQLRHSAENREHYRMFTAVHLALGEMFEADAAIPFPAPRRRAATWRWLGAAAAVILAGVLLLRFARHPADDPVAGADPSGQSASQAVLAVVAGAEGVEWDLPGPARAGVRLPAGAVKLTKGELVATLANGQTLVLRGPAAVNLVSEREVGLMAGEIGVRQESGEGVFVVRVPKGAVVCPAGEFGIRTREDGVSSLFVFDGTTSASTVGRNGRSREEEVLTKGMALDIGEQLARCSVPASAFTRVPRPLPTAESPADTAYASAVAADQPAVSWRFEEADGSSQVPATHGGQPLELRENATFAGPPGRRFLAVDDRQRSGFAYSPGPVVTLARGGFTVECLVYSASESHGSAVVLESATLGPPASRPLVRHAPQFCAIERMGRMGEHIGHIHPDYALRSVLRHPAGYDGGTNLYSGKSHLLHRWHHAALTFDGSVMRLYLDGNLTDGANGGFAWEEETVRVVVGRLHPMPQDERRQWIGGIDEVAIYPRALPAEAIARHFRALGPR